MCVFKVQKRFYPLRQSLVSIILIRPTKESVKSEYCKLPQKKFFFKSTTLSKNNEDFKICYVTFLKYGIVNSSEYFIVK